MNEVKRIRWHHIDGTVVEWFGYAGTVTTPLFHILHPVAKPAEGPAARRYDEWVLCTTFPGSATWSKGSSVLCAATYSVRPSPANCSGKRAVMMSDTWREAGGEQAAAYRLSDDGMTLVIKRRAPGGILTTTYNRLPDAGPFTDADVDGVLRSQPAATRTMQPGQLLLARRFVTTHGTLWLGLMTGPPTWWRPRMAREKDGALMAGWLRLAVAVKFTLLGKESP